MRNPIRKPRRGGPGMWMLPGGVGGDPALAQALGVVEQVASHRARSDAALRAALRALLTLVAQNHEPRVVWRVACCAILGASERPLRRTEIVAAVRDVWPAEGQAQLGVERALAALVRRAEVAVGEDGYVLLLGPGTRHA